MDLIKLITPPRRDDMLPTNLIFEKTKLAYYKHVADATIASYVRNVVARVITDAYEPTLIRNTGGRINYYE